MKNIIRVFSFVLIISCLLILTACDWFKDPDDFDNPTEVITTSGEKTKEQEMEELNNQAEEIKKQAEELLKQFEEYQHESGNEEIVEEINTENEITMPIDETKIAKEIKPNANSFSDQANWAETVENSIKIGDAGKIKLYNSIYEKEHNGEECVIAMRVDRVLTEDEVKQTITDYNNSTTIVNYPAKKTNYDWHGVKISLDLKNYPTLEGGYYVMTFPMHTIVSSDDFPYFYIDGKPYYTMESFYLRKTEPPFSQGDILEYNLIFTLPEGYKDSAYMKVINSYTDEVNKYTLFKIF